MSDHMVKKGQVAMEFLVYIGILVIIGIAAYLIINNMESSEVLAKQSYLIRETGSAFVDGISVGVLGGSGFSYVFNIPPLASLESSQYNITISTKDKVLLIEWGTGPHQLSYLYDIPDYGYSFESRCFKSSGFNYVFVSNCTDQLLLENDGTTLHIKDVKQG